MKILRLSELLLNGIIESIKYPKSCSEAVPKWNDNIHQMSQRLAGAVAKWKNSIYQISQRLAEAIANWNNSIHQIS